jgi:hypothetical protein
MKKTYSLFSPFLAPAETFKNVTQTQIMNQFSLSMVLILLFSMQIIAQENNRDSMSNFAIMVNISKPDTAYLGKLVRTVYKIHNTKPLEAEKIALEGLLLAQNANLAHSSYVFSRMLGIIASRQSKTHKGNHYLNLALSYSNRTNNPYQTKEIAHLLAKNYRAENRLDSVLYFKDIEALAKDRVFQLEKARVVHKLEEELYTEEREIQLLLEENHNQQIIIEKQSREEYILGAFLVIIAILGYVLFRNYKQKQQIQELQVNKKFEEIAHITSHQLRAPVASILGLVSIFNKEKPDDPVNQEIVQHLGKSADDLDKMLKDVVNKTYTDDNKKKK